MCVETVLQIFVRKPYLEVCVDNLYFKYHTPWIRHTPKTLSHYANCNNTIIPKTDQQVALPVGLGLHFLIDNQNYTIPMAVEEPSIIAAASGAAQFIGKNDFFFEKFSIFKSVCRHAHTHTQSRCSFNTHTHTHAHFKHKLQHSHFNKLQHTHSNHKKNTKKGKNGGFHCEQSDNVMIGQILDTFWMILIQIFTTKQITQPQQKIIQMVNFYQTIKNCQKCSNRRSNNDSTKTGLHPIKKTFSSWIRSNWVAMGGDLRNCEGNEMIGFFLKLFWKSD